MKKIEYAVAAAMVFIHHLHRPNVDRCMLATFGNTFRVEQGFTSYEPILHSTLSKISRSVTNEGTRLYDSIQDVIMQFWSDGSRNRPWLLIVITDGMENSVGGNYRKTGAAGIGRFIAERYNHSDSNFISVIGVGEDNEIDKKSLGTMGYYGNFPAMTIEAFPLLERLFIEIALQVSEKLEGIQINYGNLSWTEVSRVRQISTIPFDYAFLIDRSGSMSDEG